MGPPRGDHLRISELDPADRRTLEALFARHRVRPSHRLGQNFLVDPALRDRVAAQLAAGPGDAVLEVGAGPGTLTVALARTAARVIAVEIDRRLLSVLREVVGRNQRVEVVEGDVLKLALPAVPVVAGNIPYYLTGALLPRLLDRRPLPQREAHEAALVDARLLQDPGLADAEADRLGVSGARQDGSDRGHRTRCHPDRGNHVAECKRDCAKGK